MVDVVMGRDKCQEQCLLSLPLVLHLGHHEEFALPEVSRINQEVLLLRAKAMELFVQYLATYSYRPGSGKEKKAQCFIKYCRGIRNFPVSCRHITKEDTS